MCVFVGSRTRAAESTLRKDVELHRSQVVYSLQNIKLHRYKYIFVSDQENQGEPREDRRRAQRSAEELPRRSSALGRT